MIDLHIHSNHSDGADPLENILKKAETKKLDTISITDHDSIAAYFELEHNSCLKSLFSGKIITGCEFKTFYGGISIEVLGYGFDYKKIKMPKNDSKKIQELYLDYFKSILDKYGFIYNPLELYIDFNNPRKHYAGFVLANEILNHKENESLIKQMGVFTAYDFFRVHQSNKNSIFYIDESKYYPDIKQIIDLIHEAGGLAFLAHPYIYQGVNQDDLVKNIIENTEIDGIECIYPLFTEEQRKQLMMDTKKYKKFASGGTDYHGNMKPNIELGSGINNNVTVDECLILDWINLVKRFK